MEIVDVVRKLVGKIEPIGETHTDGERLRNLKEMTSLLDALLYDIQEIADHKDSPQYSLAQAGKHASNFIKYIHNEFKDR